MDVAMKCSSGFVDSHRNSVSTRHDETFAGLRPDTQGGHGVVRLDRFGFTDAAARTGDFNEQANRRHREWAICGDLPEVNDVLRF